MNTSQNEQSGYQQQPVTSQTGAPQQPIQVENVQYGVHVGKFITRVGLAFMVASLSLGAVLLTLAWTLYEVVGAAFGFGSDMVGELVVLLIALSVPLVPLHLFSAKRLKMLLENPANVEDLIFKKNMRMLLGGAILLGVFYTSYGLYNGLSILFLDKVGNAAEAFSSVVFFGGGFALFGLWVYTFQKMTQR